MVHCRAPSKGKFAVGGGGAQLDLPPGNTVADFLRHGLISRESRRFIFCLESGGEGWALRLIQVRFPLPSRGQRLEDSVASLHDGWGQPRP